MRQRVFHMPSATLAVYCAPGGRCMDHDATTGRCLGGLHPLRGCLIASVSRSVVCASVWPSACPVWLCACCLLPAVSPSHGPLRCCHPPVRPSPQPTLLHACRSRGPSECPAMVSTGSLALRGQLASCPAPAGPALTRVLRPRATAASLRKHVTWAAVVAAHLPAAQPAASRLPPRASARQQPSVPVPPAPPRGGRAPRRGGGGGARRRAGPPPPPPGAARGVWVVTPAEL